MPINLITLLAVTIISQISNLPSDGGLASNAYVLPENKQIILDDDWIVDSTLTVLHQLDTLQQYIDYNVVRGDTISVITITDRIAKGDTLNIYWQSASITNRTLFYYYSPAIRTDSDRSAQIPTITKPTKPLDPLGSWGNIRRSGTLTRGIKVSQDGSGDVVSGLHLEMSGRPSPDISINAIIDDRSLPASSGGGSTTLSELDKLLFQVTTPHLSAQMGDWDMAWNIGQYGNVSRRLKGGGLSVNYPVISTEVIAATKDNTFRTMSFTGRDGDQGPYELTDKLGRSGISVLSGSEKVHLNGRSLVRGIRADYTVDYLRGGITFNPTVPISSDSRIEVDFEHSDETYQRNFYGWRVKIPPLLRRGGKDSDPTSVLRKGGKIPDPPPLHSRGGIKGGVASQNGFSLEAFTLMESHDNNNPITFEWSDSWKEILSNAGDNTSAAQVSGIDSVGLGNGDYIYADSNDVRIIKFSLPDSLGKPTGYLSVIFRADSVGSYRREYDAKLQSYYYLWVGDGLGDWSPQLLLPLPERVNQNGLALSYHSDRWQIESEVALSQYDKNVMSTLDDDDNVGSAWKFQSIYRPDTARGLSLNTKIRHEDARFHPLSRVSSIDHQYRWGLTDDANESETEVAGNIGFVSPDKYQIQSSGAYLSRGNSYTGIRADLSGELNVKNYTVATQIDRTEGVNSLYDRRSVRDRYNGSIIRKSELFQPTYKIRLEDQRAKTDGSLSDGYRLLEQEIGSTYKVNNTQDVRFGFAYLSDDKFGGETIDHESDARTLQIGWNGKKPATGGWSLDLLRQYQTYTKQLSVTSTSARLNGYVRPVGSSWNGRINYSLITGSQRSGIQVAQYVGSGHGGYRREGDRYVPDPDGDFIMNEVMSDSLERVSRVNCTAQLEWKHRKSNRRSHEAGNPDIEKPAPLGLTGSLTRFEADLSTSDNNPWRGYLLDPTAFRADEVVYSHWSWNEELSFLDGNPKGDGRLTLRYDERRDRALSGGEAQTEQASSFRSRHRLHKQFNVRFQPSWERYKRWGIRLDETRSNVVQMAGETEVSLTKINEYFEIGLEYRYDLRKDAVTFVRVDERKLTGRFKWTLKQSGMLHIEGVYRKLSASVNSAGYDLTKGWAIGDNWNATASLDYQLRSSLSMSMTYIGRWRGLSPPSHAGQIELTAYLK